MCPNQESETCGGICLTTVNTQMWGGVQNICWAWWGHRERYREARWLIQASTAIFWRSYVRESCLTYHTCVPSFPTSLPWVSSLYRACVHGKRWYRGEINYMGLEEAFPKSPDPVSGLWHSSEPIVYFPGWRKWQSIIDCFFLEVSVNCRTS